MQNPLKLVSMVCLSTALLLTLGCDEKTETDHTSQSDIRQTAAYNANTANQGKAMPTAEPVLFPVPGDPTVSFNVWFKVGSQNDPPGKEGLAYVTANLLSQGATTQNSYEDILAKLYPLAASYRVRVDREMTTLSGRTHRDNLQTFFQLFTDAYVYPKFDSTDFERIRSDALNAIENTLRFAADEELGKAAFMHFVYGGTRYQHPNQGTVQGLKSITLADVRQFYKTYFTGSNVVLGLGGGFDKGLVSLLRKTLGDMPEGMPPASPVIEAARINGRQVLLVDKPGADASISFGFPISVRRGDRDYYALWLANSWLGEHRNSSSHLYQVIRSARGLNYGDYSYIEAYPEGGFRSKPPTNVARQQQCFEVWIRTLPNNQAVFATRAALRELQDLVDHGMTKDEFELTRSFLKKYILHFAETTTQRLGYAIDDRFYGLEKNHLARFQEVLKDLTLKEVNDAIRKHLQYKNIKIAIATGEAEMIREQLTSGKATAIEYESEKSSEVMQEDQIIASVRLDIKMADVQIVSVTEMFER